MNRGVLLRAGAIALIVLIPVTIYLAPALAGFIVGVVGALSPLWLPPLLFVIAWPLWLTFARSRYVAGIEYTTLELKPGDNTPKTARPMEVVFYALYYRQPVEWREALLKGVVRLPWGFEIAASGGTVRLLLHIPTHHRAMIEARLRAEYKDIDIDEVRDYSREKAFNPLAGRVLMREFTLGKPDPYPLMTYEAHEHGKERRDPFAEMLEELVAVPEGQTVWVSLLVRPHQRDWGRGVWDWLYDPTDTLHDAASAEIEKLVGRTGDLRGLPENVQRTVNAIEKGLTKPSFDCGLRVLYIADKRAWSIDRATHIESLFDRFGDATLNTLVPYDPRSNVGWPLSDVFAVLPGFDDEYFIKLYRRRAFFAPPYYGKSFVLNTEELATLWHLPKFGRSSALNRGSGTRLEPPDNLPL